MKRLEEEGKKMSGYSYEDKERNMDMDTVVKKDVIEAEDEYRKLKEAMDRLEKKVGELEKGMDGADWEEMSRKGEDVGKEIGKEVGKARQQIEEVEEAGERLNELVEKYRVKDMKYRECGEKQREKQGQIEELKE